MYQEQFLHRQMQNHRTFQRLHCHLLERGSFHVTRNEAGLKDLYAVQSLEEIILNFVANRPESCSRAVAHNVGLNQQIVWREVNENQFHRFFYQQEQSLNQEDYPRRLNFCQWILQHIVLHPAFTAYVVFTNETIFTRKGVLNELISKV